MALAVVGSGVPAQEWRSEISDLLFALGWRSGGDQYSPPPAHSPTLDVLEQLAGAHAYRWSDLDGHRLRRRDHLRAVTGWARTARTSSTGSTSVTGGRPPTVGRSATGSCGAWGIRGRDGSGTPCLDRRSRRGSC